MTTWAFTIIGLVVISLSAGCGSKELSPSPLSDQILRLRDGYSGLTHRYCEKEDFTGCVQYKVLEIKPTKQSVEDLKGAGIVCNINGYRYRPCYLNEFAFCRQTFEKKLFKTEKKMWVYRLNSDRKKLKDRGIICFNDKKYPFYFYD